MNWKCIWRVQPMNKKCIRRGLANEPKLDFRNQSTKVHNTDWANESKCALASYSVLENEYWGRVADISMQAGLN